MKKFNFFFDPQIDFLVETSIFRLKKRKQNIETTLKNLEKPGKITKIALTLIRDGGAYW